MNKNIITYVTVASLAFIPMVTFAADPSVGGSFSTADPSTGSSSSTADPSTGGSASTANPPTGGSGSTAAPAGSTGGGSTGGSTGSSGSSGSSSGRSSSGGGRSFNPYCTLITSYMKLGANNDSAQVTKLQNFLKNTEKLDVDVNGIFDTKTETAVKSFQNKYSAETMGPWGVKEGNGNVFMTTVKKINQIACNQPLTLNPSELAIINSYRMGNRSVNSTGPTIEIKATPVSTDGEDNLKKDDSETIEVGSVDENKNSNTASVGDASILKRFWNFVLFLFR
ncbi:MAG: peptidoglycan-binding domain-containing protein [Candidatus Paceibacterota bacterium]